MPIEKAKQKIHKIRAHAAEKSSVLYEALKKSELMTILYTFMTAKTPEEAGYKSSVSDDLRSAISGPIKAALMAILIGFFIFLIWGGIAPLDSAAIAEGVVVVSGNKKMIQHLEGGIVEQIAIKDGDRVKKGQLLVKLNDTNARAQLKILSAQINFAIATRARLVAEQGNYEKIEWDESEFDYSDPEIKTVLVTQEKLFQARKSEYQSQIAILKEKIGQNENQLTSLVVKQNSLNSQLGLINDEIKSTEHLFEKGLALRPRLLELRRYHDDLISQYAEVVARMSILKQNNEENKLQMVTIENQFFKDVSRELKENHSQILEFSEKYNATKDVLDRTEIISPIDGVIVDLQVHTIGGVIAPGHKILEVVPQDAEMIIEAKVKTQDIDSIHPGLIARVQLGAYKSRLVPRLDGKVIYVAADRSVDQSTGQAFYLARISIDDAEIAKLNMEVSLYPGMPVSVFIVKGSRTFLEYMISPLKDSLFKALKEA